MCVHNKGKRSLIKQRKGCSVVRQEEIVFCLRRFAYSASVQPTYMLMYTHTNTFVLTGQAYFPAPSCSLWISHFLKPTHFKHTLAHTHIPCLCRQEAVGATSAEIKSSGQILLYLSHTYALIPVLQSVLHRPSPKL